MWEGKEGKTHVERRGPFKLREFPKMGVGTHIKRGKRESKEEMREV
jgi:hypothetical protein